ncbi:MAG: LOG family protein [Planctomycetes bacterium]|nr:LOG family protein [Planctomycetota bacterium]
MTVTATKRILAPTSPPLTAPVHVTPQTDDGVVARVLSCETNRCEVEVRIPLEAGFQRMVAGREKELVLASRSRIARIGIDLTPTSPIAIERGAAQFRARLEVAIPGYDVGKYLHDAVVPGLRIGRLVFCPEERRLDSRGILDAIREGALQLPAAYSIDERGRFTIRTHRRVYDLTRPLTRDDVLTILASAEGRSVLNRMQVARDVENVVMEPGQGVITSCSMFLHRHYVVLDREPGQLGKHLQAIVLDPVRTRGTRVFLEFTNCSQETIVNPSVSARVYEAQAVEPAVRVFPVVLPKGTPAELRQKVTFDATLALFDRLQTAVHGGYFDRFVAVVDDWDAIARGEAPRLVWHSPNGNGDRIEKLRATRDYSNDPLPIFGTSVLSEIPLGARSTVLLGYFPNLIEHVELCKAAIDRRIARIVFRRASFEHGPFLSAKDQARLADYAALGVEVFWCNEDWGHLAVHTFRGLRGYFLQPHLEARFQNALVIAIYGSARPLTAVDDAKLRELLTSLKGLFGDNLAILTGGGPGAMQQASVIAHDLGLLVGANYIETVDQATNKDADFYQCFQDSSRHNRQRWFEIASFQIFCTGGLGTLEEIGLTMTDMKLGVIEMSPVVFFGQHGNEPYWESMRRQFKVMVQDKRAPDWLDKHVMMTDDPRAVPPFYKRILELG